MANNNIGEKLIDKIINFTAGTQAKAGEVNENFDKTQTHVDAILSLGWHRMVDSEGSDLTASHEGDEKISVPDNQEDMYSSGMFIRIDQTTGGTKYFVMNDVTFDSQNSKTNITLDGRGTYTVANESIDNPVFSTVSNPYEIPAEISGNVQGQYATKDIGWALMADSSGTLQQFEFVSSNTITDTLQTANAVDVTDIISKGMKIKFTQSTGSNPKHAWIVTSPTVNGNSKTEFEILTTYSVTNNTISDSKVGIMDNPFGWDQPNPGARIYLGSDQSVSDDTDTKVAIDSTRSASDDPFGMFNSSNNSITTSVESAYWYIEGAIFHHDGGGKLKAYFGFVFTGDSSKNRGEQRHDDGNTNFESTNITSRPFDYVGLGKGDEITLEGRNQTSDGTDAQFLSNPERTYLIVRLVDWHKLV